MNRKDWRRIVLRRVSWRSDLSQDTIDDVNEQLNLAQKKLASDCPGAFRPDTECIVLLPDVTDASSGRTMAATVDPWVMDFGLVSSGEAFVTDGTWDGLYHLEAADGDGQLHRRQIREFWSADSPADGLPHYFAALDRPWRSVADTGMSFRLHQPEFFFRDDVTEVLDGAAWALNRTQLVPIPEDFLAHYGEHDYRGNAKGPPDYLVRGRQFQLDAPTKTPTLARDTHDNPGYPWLGPHPLVTCRMVYTYVWGKKDAELLAPQGSYDPLWESSPSPVSNSVTMPDGTMRLKLTGLPNIDFMQGFDTTGTLRKGHSGIRKRIYVYIDGIVAGGGFGTDSIEAQGVPLYLGEVDGNVTEFTWDGSTLPDYKRRLPESQGYYAHRMATHQDKRYEIDFRVRRRPRDLGTEYDAPPLLVNGDEALVRLGMSYVNELQKKPDDAARDFKIYEEQELPRVFKLINNAEKVVPGVPWGYPSVRVRRNPWGRLGPFIA